MYTKLAAILSCFLAVALAGCVSSSAKLNNVRNGMTKADVVALLGPPDSTRAHANTEYLTYYLSNDSSVREQPYMVRLVDAKVESFGRFFQLPDENDRPASGSAQVSIGTIMPYSMNTSIVTHLQQLLALKNQGVLTDEEFQRVKQRLLAERD